MYCIIAARATTATEPGGRRTEQARTHGGHWRQPRARDDLIRAHRRLIETMQRQNETGGLRTGQRLTRMACPPGCPDPSPWRAHSPARIVVPRSRNGDRAAVRVADREGSQLTDLRGRAVGSPYDSCIPAVSASRGTESRW